MCSSDLEYETAVKDLGEALAITASEKRVAELEHKMSQPGFYDDAEASQKVFAEVSDLKGKLERYRKLTRLYDDADTMLLLCEEENDPEMIPEAEESVHKVAEAIDELQMITLLSGEYDKNNAIPIPPIRKSHIRKMSTSVKRGALKSGFSSKGKS